jgi:hypothetical protein
VVVYDRLADEHILDVVVEADAESGAGAGVTTAVARGATMRSLIEAVAEADAGVVDETGEGVGAGAGGEMASDLVL